MTRPTGWTPYVLADGTAVPSVTTVIGRFKESGGLIHWAWKLGVEGRDYRDVRDSAANSGTIAHAMVESSIRGVEFVPPTDIDDDVLTRAAQAFANYLLWARQSRLEAIDTERRLVSEKHRFGGTLDAMLISGKLSLGDWKTSDSVYQDYLIQLAAYGLLWAENYPDRPIEGGYHLLRFAKDAPDFVHYHFGDLKDAATAFLLMRELFDLDKRLKARVR
jgi:hypothetical protein